MVQVCEYKGCNEETINQIVFDGIRMWFCDKHMQEFIDLTNDLL